MRSKKLLARRKLRHGNNWAGARGGGLLDQGGLWVDLGRSMASRIDSPAAHRGLFGVLFRVITLDVFLFVPF